MIATIIEMLAADAKATDIYRTLRREFGCTGARAVQAMREAQGLAEKD